MAGFKRRPSGIELAGQLEDVTAALPAATAAPEPAARAVAARPERVELVQINFRASKGLAKLVARLSEEAGSTRRLVARLLRDGGHDVPEIDLNPPDTRRRFDD